MNMEQLLSILNEICPGVDFENEKNLIDDEIIDSFDMIAVVSEIMDAFSVEIGVEDIIPENFNSVEAMMNLIERLK